MSISNKFNSLDTIKSQIKQAIIDKGVTVSDSDGFGTYAGKISLIPAETEPVLQDKTVVANGTVTAGTGYDGLGTVVVDVPTGSGTGVLREVSAQGVYQMPSQNFTFSLSNNVTDVGSFALYFAFRECPSLTSVDLSSLTTISSMYGLNSAFYKCTNLTSVDLSSLTTVSAVYAMSNSFEGCTSLTSVDLSSLITLSGGSAIQYAFQGCTSLISVDLSSLTTISGNNAMFSAFLGCTSLTSVDLSNLTIISGNYAMQRTFRRCTALKSLSFPVLTSTSFGSGTNQFSKMLEEVTDCTVHFPSNLQAVIGNWSDVTAGFGGTNTTILFDLPATT